MGSGVSVGADLRREQALSKTLTIMIRVNSVNLLFVCILVIYFLLDRGCPPGIAGRPSSLEWATLNLIINE